MATAQSPTAANIGRSPQNGLGRLAAWCYDHRRRVLAGWLLAVVAIIGLAQWAGSRLDNNFALTGSPSQQAQNLLASRFPAQKGDSADVVLRSLSPLDSPVNAAAIGRLVRSLRPLAHVSGVQSPLAPGGGARLSADRRTGFVVVQFDAAAADLPAKAVWRMIDTARSFAHRGLQVAVGGAPVENVVSAAPGSAEMIGLVAAVVVMLLAFGSVVAMGLPILTALAGLGIGFGVLEALSHLVTVPAFGPDMMIMIGLGVGIDYALFVVTRYRQGLAEGRPPREATVVALSTAGRAVLFAGGTVVIALLGLFVVGLPFMDGLAAATIVAVALVLAAALTLLPAIFGFAGTAIDRLHIPGLLARPGPATSRGFWRRWSRTVQRRPWICAALALAVLGVLAVPLFSMRLAFSDAGNDPASLTTRQAYDLLAEGFGPGFNGPLVIAANLRGPHAQAGIARLGARLRQVPGVATADPPVVNAARDAAVIVVYPATAPQSAQTAALLRLLRGQVIPQVTAGSGVTAFVGGETAAGVDTSAYLSGRLPWVIGMVVALALVLLVVVFRSVAIPLKAAAVNLLSMGAAYGVIVAVYQWGWLARVFGASPGPIDPWIPLMMFTIVFGLSMDYEVFLLSRMREEWARSRDNSQAVASGLASTARVITTAAAIMVCVFGSFVIGDPVRILGVFGLGLAVAVLVDATVVRLVLVPAVMQLLGTANWWLPRWMARAIPSLSIEPDADQLAGGGPGYARPVSAKAAEPSRRSPREAPQPWSHGPEPANGAIKMPDSPGETARARLSRRR
jgi:RND superfamily putative drug exporter